MPFILKSIKTRKKLVLVFLISFFVIFFGGNEVEATDDISVHLGPTEIIKGYTIEKPDGLMKLAVFPNVLETEADITVKSSDSEGTILPEDLKLVSGYFEFDIKTEPIKIFAKDVIVVLKYDSDNFKTKKIYFWDKNQAKWRPLYSQTNFQDKSVRAYTHLPYSKIAVFEDSRSEEGYASWYRSSKYTHGAAINEYPINTYLKVISLENGKSTKVKVVSHGLYAANRIIDLTSTAFKELAPTWQGLIKVHIEPIDSAVEVETQTQPTAANSSAVSINAQSAVIYNPSNDGVIYDKNSTQIRSIASITKIMTVIVFLETNPNFDSTYTMTKDDVTLEAQAVKIKSYSDGVFNTFTLRDLFGATLTGSANDAALAIARSTGLSQAEFVSRMNKRAKSIGMNNTSFTEPSGMDPENKSTALDVSKMIKYAMQRPGIRSLTTTHTYTYTIVNTGEKRTIHNPMYLYNTLLNDQPIVGGKTGYLMESGHCLAAEARKNDGQEFVVVTLGSSSTYNRSLDVKKLINYGLTKI